MTSPLHEAIITRNKIGLNFLLKNRFFSSEEEKRKFVNIKNEKGFSAFHLAVRGNYLEGAQILLDHRADIESQNNKNHTPLYTTVIFDEINMAQFLLSNGANQFVKGKWGKTLLHEAARRGYYEMARLLIGWDYFGLDLKAGLRRQTPRQMVSNNSRLYDFLFFQEIKMKEGYNFGKKPRKCTYLLQIWTKLKKKLNGSFFIENTKGIP